MSMKLWFFRLHMAWSALRGDFDGEFDLPTLPPEFEPEFAKVNEILKDLPFIEAKGPIEIKTSLPPSVWRAYNQGKPL